MFLGILLKAKSSSLRITTWWSVLEPVWQWGRVAPPLSKLNPFGYEDDGNPNPLSIKLV